MQTNHFLRKPDLVLPSPLRGADINTFAHLSIVKRLPLILAETLAANDFPRDVRRKLQAIVAEIPTANIRPLPAADPWQVFLEPYGGMNWLQAPWFFVETYFYRRVLAATGFFQADAGAGKDPFAVQKLRSLQTAGEAINRLTAAWSRWVFEVGEAALPQMLAAALWGNQADLSMWPAGGMPMPESGNSTTAWYLVDDRARVATHIANYPSAQIDIILDNVGMELAADLALASFLLATDCAVTVRLHAKSHPTFVSDATVADVEQTVRTFAAHENQHTRRLGELLEVMQGDGRLQLAVDPFWTSPLPAWEMPDALLQDLAQAQLVFVKGDANYRRLVGDRKWPFTTPFSALLSYFQAPLVALRTFKSEVAVGLTPVQLSQVWSADREWLVNGRWGIVQMAIPGAP